MDLIEQADEIIDCLASFPCADSVRKVLETERQLIIYQEPDNSLCLKGFFKEAYEAQFSNKQSCYREFSFLDKEASKRRDAYTNGKLCFIKYVRENCEPSTLDYFTHRNYQTFTELMSATQFDSSCDSLEVYLYSLLESTIQE